MRRSAPRHGLLRLGFERDDRGRARTQTTAAGGATTIGTATTVASTATTAGAAGGDTDGGLLILDGSGNVVVLAPDGSGSNQITDDAGPDQVYLQPTWSPDGDRVVVTSLTAEGSTVLVAPLDGESIPTTTEFAPFYFQWSPVGDRVAFLGTPEQGGIALGMLDAAAGTVETIDTGQPYYFHWSTDGSRLAVHVGSDRLDLIDPVTGDRTPLGQTPGTFQAPEWHPDGSRLVAVLRAEAGGVNASYNSALTQGSTQRLAVIDVESGEVEEVATIDGAVASQMSPGGDRIAYNVAGPNGGEVWVTDLAGGRPERVARGTVVALQWSPGGDRLLMLRLAPDNVAPVVPIVWDGSERTEFPGFTPTRAFLSEYLPFWEQYSRGLTLWSPDGQAFAYPAAGPDGDRILVQPVSATEPLDVGAGTVVAWSP